MKKSVVVKMQQDFEARPIANLVQVANRYESKSIWNMVTAVSMRRALWG